MGLECMSYGGHNKCIQNMLAYKYLQQTYIREIFTEILSLGYRLLTPSFSWLSSFIRRR